MSTNSPDRRLQLRRGAVGAGWGVLAYVVGVATATVLEGEEKASTLEEAFRANVLALTPPSDLTAGAWTYHVSHVGVGLDAAMTVGSQSRSASAGAFELSETYLYILPPLALVLVGYVMARRSGWRSLTPPGAGFVAGYAVSMGVGAALLFEWNETADVVSSPEVAEFTIGPDLLASVAFGAVYAALFAATGAFLSAYRRPAGG